MNDDLLLALKEAMRACNEIDPAELNAGDRELWHACDDRCEQIIEVLIREHDECGPAARAIIQRFMLPQTKGRYGTGSALPG